METLLDALPDQVARLAWALGVTSDVETAVESARSSFGTCCWDAYQAHASATEKLRNLALGGGGARVADVPRLLCAALEADSSYEAPRLVLLEHATQRLAERDAEYARVLVDQLDRLRNDRLVHGLLRFESLLVLDERDAAASLLSDLQLRFAGDSALVGAKARLG